MRFRPGDKVRHGTGTDGPVLEVLGEDCSAPQEAFHVRYPNGTCACYHESSLFPAQDASSPVTPKQPTTVREIVVQYLEANGFDGLFNADGECGCELADLIPCDGECIAICEPGYKRKPGPDDDPDYVFIIGPDKPEAAPSAPPKCSCGADIVGGFCSSAKCGKPAPEPEPSGADGEESAEEFRAGEESDIAAANAPAPEAEQPKETALRAEMACDCPEILLGAEDIVNTVPRKVHRPGCPFGKQSNQPAAAPEAEKPVEPGA